MRKTPLFVLIYATCVLLGGVIGYVQAGSVASLISGVSFGLLLFLSCLLMFKKELAGYLLALFLTFLLEGFFAWRFAKSLAFLPAGFLSFFTLAVIIVLCLKMRQRRRLTR